MSTKSFQSPLKAEGARHEVHGRLVGDRLDAVVDGEEEHGVGAAAGLSGSADAGAIDVGEGEEIIDGADGVPGLEARGGIAGEEHLATAGGVFVIDRAGAGALPGGIGVVDAFALAHGVEAKGDEAKFHECLAEALIGGVGLAVGSVAHLHEYGGGGTA